MTKPKELSGDICGSCRHERSLHGGPGTSCQYGTPDDCTCIEFIKAEAVCSACGVHPAEPGNILGLCTACDVEQAEP